jgi:hypothetical protein
LCGDSGCFLFQAWLGKCFDNLVFIFIFIFKEHILIEGACENSGNLVSGSKTQSSTRDFILKKYIDKTMSFVLIYIYKNK